MFLLSGLPIPGSFGLLMPVTDPIPVNGRIESPCFSVDSFWNDEHAFEFL